MPMPMRMLDDEDDGGKMRALEELQELATALQGEELKGRYGEPEALPSDDIPGAMTEEEEEEEEEEREGVSGDMPRGQGMSLEKLKLALAKL